MQRTPFRVRPLVFLALAFGAVDAAFLACSGGSSSTPPESADGGSGADATSSGADAKSSGADATSSGTDARSSGGDASAPPADDADVPPRPSAGCTGNASAASGDLQLDVQGQSRSYRLHVPTTPSASPRPLVISLHGYFLSSTSQEDMTAMSPLADKEGFVVAYPSGLGIPANWNAGGCCGSALEVDRDDRGFIRAVVDDIGAHTCIDTARTYVVGFSNGGMMTVRLACEMADTFAAAVTVSGSAMIPLESCLPSKPIAFMHIHGTADALVPYDGGSGGLPLLGRPTPVFPPVSAEVARLRNSDGCAATTGTYRETSDTHCELAGPCGASAEVVLCTVDGGGHAWPTPSGRTGTGTWNETSSFDATTEIWSFMKRHALR